jgi:hypothetical protein
MGTAELMKEQVYEIGEKIISHVSFFEQCLIILFLLLAGHGQPSR